MQNEGNPPHRIDPLLKAALSHPKRIEILGYLMRERQAASDSQLAKAVDLTLRRAEYHLKVLHNADLIAQVEDRREQGEAGHSFIAATVADR